MTGADASLRSRVSFAGQCVVRLQARRTNSVGASGGAQILSNTDGMTALRYRRVA